MKDDDGYLAMWAAEGVAATRTIDNAAPLTGAHPFSTIPETGGA